MPKCELSTKIIPATCAWVLIIGCTSLYFAFVCRYLTENYSYAFPIAQGIITMFVMFNIYLATFMDPGIFPRAPDDESKDDDFCSPLYKNIEIKGVPTRMKWCTTCQFYRPPRSSHCSSCDNCIETFDHHCPWLNNCIGRRNYRYFIAFLLSMCVHLVTIFSQCVFYTMKHDDDLLQPGPIIAIVIMIIIGLGCIPVFGLTGFHMFLVSQGTTTNEQVTGKYKGIVNPFHRGCMRNWCYVFFGPRWPKLVGYIPKTRTVKLDSSKITYMAAENDVSITVGNNSNGGLRQASHKNHNLRPRSTHELDEYMDKSSQSFDCEPSPPFARKQDGSYTNLFESGGQGPNNHYNTQPSSGDQGSQHKLSSNPIPSSRNTFDRPSGWSGPTAATHNGKKKAPLVAGEDDSFDATDQRQRIPSINSPGIHRSRSETGTAIQSSDNKQQHLPPRGPSSKPLPRIGSPTGGRHNPSSVSPPSGPGYQPTGRPPQSPVASNRSVTSSRDVSYSTLPPGTSVVKDRARNFYPSKSRENLARSRDYLDQSKDSIQSTGSHIIHSTSQGNIYYSTDRLNREAKAREGYRTLGRDKSQDDVFLSDNSRPTNNSHQDSDRYRTETGTAGRHEASDRNRNSSNKDRSSSRDFDRPRDRDRSKSFDFDPPGERSAGSRGRAGASRDRSLPRNLSDTSGANTPHHHPRSHQHHPSSSSNHSSSSPPPHPQHHSLSGYQPLLPSGYSTATTGSIGSNSLRSTTSSSGNHPPPHHHPHNSSSLQQTNAASPTPTPSIVSTSSRHPSHSSSSHLLGSDQHRPPMSFVRAMQVTDATDIREKRIKERIRRQSQSSRKDATKSMYDTYEASV